MYLRCVQKWHYSLNHAIFLKNLDNMTFEAKMSCLAVYDIRIIQHFWRGRTICMCYTMVHKWHLTLVCSRIVSSSYILTCKHMTLVIGCKHVDQKMHKYPKTIIFLVKHLKVVAESCLNWISFQSDLYYFSKYWKVIPRWDL